MREEQDAGLTLSERELLRLTATQTSASSTAPAATAGPQHARHVVIDNVLVTAPGKSIVGINSNLGDTAKISRVTIVGDSAHKMTVCQRFTGVTSGEPKEAGSGPDATNCRYTAADITYRP